MAATEEDLSAQFMRRRDEQRQDAALQEMMQRVAAATPPADPLAAEDETEPAAPTGSLASRAVRDVGRGIVETPRAVVKGARDAFGSLFDMGDDLANWLEEKSADTPFRFMNAGVRFTPDGIEFMSP